MEEQYGQNRNWDYYSEIPLEPKVRSKVQNPCAEIPLGKPTLCRLPPMMYKSGDIFHNEHGYWILAQVASETFVLIALFDGNRWNDPLKAEEGEMFIQNCEVCITQAFFNKLSKGSVHWKRIGSWNELTKNGD
ncbi:MAG: hypothetical protein M0R80_02625 [Proteobacteria bacterium]|nr:hypothetical protein [Pseudomonadota bacterium]